MGIKTTYTCDRCGHTQDNDKQMWKLLVSLAHHGNEHNYSTTKQEVLWCRSCVEKYGFLPIPSEKEKPDVPPPAPTIEDMILEIVASAMNQ